MSSEVLEMNVRYIALGMVFVFIGIAGLLYFHGMAIVQPEKGTVDANQAKALTLLGLYTGMGCLLVGTIGGSLIGYSICYNADIFSANLNTQSLGIKYCRYCGSENKNDAHFCEKCGKKLG